MNFLSLNSSTSRCACSNVCTEAATGGCTRGPQGKGYESDWRKAGRHGPPRASWLVRDHVFFGVHPHADIPTKNAQGKKRDQRWVRGTVHNIAAINALFVELDAKDTILQAEWLPYYVTPDVGSMEKAQARGALQKAQTAAIDAALPLRLDEYKQRALAALQAAPLRPSACWDSGGGYQAVWLLDATLPVTDANRSDVAAIQKEWVRSIGGDPAASDLNRVLRLPGSVNRKPKYGPQGHPVTFAWCDLDLVYEYTHVGRVGIAPGTCTRHAPHVCTSPTVCPLPWVSLPKCRTCPSIPPSTRITPPRTCVHCCCSTATPTPAPGRMHRPGGNTAGVQLHAGNTASIYSSADPLWCGHRITPAHALCVFEYDGDIKAMLAGLTSGQLYLFSSYAANAVPALQALSN